MTKGARLGGKGSQRFKGGRRRHAVSLQAPSGR